LERAWLECSILVSFSRLGSGNSTCASDYEWVGWAERPLAEIQLSNLSPDSYT